MINLNRYHIEDALNVKISSTLAVSLFCIKIKSVFKRANIWHAGLFGEGFAMSPVADRLFLFENHNITLAVFEFEIPAIVLFDD